MRPRPALWLAAAACALMPEVAIAEASQAKPAMASAHSKPARAPHSARSAASADAPCPRGKWKDDPVCFGEDDPNALPTPSVTSAERSTGSKTDVTIKPSVNLNSRLTGPGVIYKDDGTTVTSDFGGGVGLHLPF